jgi:hypothetical protein
LLTTDSELQPRLAPSSRLQGEALNVKKHAALLSELPRAAEAVSAGWCVLGTCHPCAPLECHKCHFGTSESHRGTTAIPVQIPRTSVPPIKALWPKPCGCHLYGDLQPQSHRMGPPPPRPLRLGALSTRGCAPRTISLCIARASRGLRLCAHHRARTRRHRHLRRSVPKLYAAPILRLPSPARGGVLLQIQTRRLVRCKANERAVGQLGGPCASPRPLATMDPYLHRAGAREIPIRIRSPVRFPSMHWLAALLDYLAPTKD